MEHKQRLIVVLPEVMSDNIEVQIVRSESAGRYVTVSGEADGSACLACRDARKFALVWDRQDYVNIRLDELLWVSASGSYSVLHLKGERELVVSSNLSAVGRKLPLSEFARIHRSCIVNLNHVCQLVGNELSVAGTMLHIGREYRESVFSRFIFIGAHRDKPSGK